MNRGRGSSAVEFILAFSAAAIMFLFVVRIVAFSVAKELAAYTDYMNYRALKIYRAAEKTKRMACEDNPFWYVKGDESCEF